MFLSGNLIINESHSYILNLEKIIKGFFLENGFDNTFSQALTILALCGIFIAFLFILNFLIQKVFIKYLIVFTRKTSFQFDDYLVKNKTFNYLNWFIVIWISSLIGLSLIEDFPKLHKSLSHVFTIAIIVIWIGLIRSVFKSVHDSLLTKKGWQDKPLGSYFQLISIVLYFIGFILIFTNLTGTDPWKFLGAFGAMSAVLMLVFKDTILGLVASVQVSVNDTVRIGDWIEMPKYGADGDVIEINLNTVKIQNWDKTITSIPTHFLVSDSFKNWRGMQATGGRRIKRSLQVKISSIRFLEAEEIENLKKIQLLKPYIEERQVDIEKFNNETGADPSMPINGRRMTNVGLFRNYVSAYLRNNPKLRQDMTVMVRQLAPTEHGLPIEIYAFSADIIWINYEGIMSDIFDHVFAAIKYFDLEVFELPASDDLRKYTEQKGLPPDLEVSSDKK